MGDPEFPPTETEQGTLNNRLKDCELSLTQLFQKAEEIKNLLELIRKEKSQSNLSFPDDDIYATADSELLSEALKYAKLNGCDIKTALLAVGK